MFSINIGVMLPIALEGYDLQYTENRYLISGTKEKAKEVALKLIDELIK